ncbi:hypothetical protein LG651_08650 [Tamlana sp. 62-3]|uniref:Uncharacterized protein n=1 Tax=Neotamlana sargassicola TaxID=2883125 RepID=A0A9X1I7Q3_9FLAO|nr:hypothetical protein [Tamlana sargassicola]MCB4808319.1 hypothetical protein [Tamlana sargassicola]
MKTQLTIALMLFLAFCRLHAQVGYQRDSLQIKAYATIDYIDGNATAIKVKHVFCDYCSEYQKEKISEEAKRQTFLIRNAKGVRMLNGVYRHAVYIRVSKEDFANLKEEEEESENQDESNKNTSNKY